MDDKVRKYEEKYQEIKKLNLKEVSNVEKIGKLAAEVSRIDLKKLDEIVDDLCQEMNKYCDMVEIKDLYTLGFVKGLFFKLSVDECANIIEKTCVTKYVTSYAGDEIIDIIIELAKKRQIDKSLLLWSVYGCEDMDFFLLSVVADYEKMSYEDKSYLEEIIKRAIYTNTDIRISAIILALTLNLMSSNDIKKFLKDNNFCDFNDLVEVLFAEVINEKINSFKLLIEGVYKKIDNDILIKHWEEFIIKNKDKLKTELDPFEGLVVSKIGSTLARESDTILDYLFKELRFSYLHNAIIGDWISMGDWESSRKYLEIAVLNIKDNWGFSSFWGSFKFRKKQKQVYQVSPEFWKNAIWYLKKDDIEDFCRLLLDVADGIGQSRFYYQYLEQAIEIIDDIWDSKKILPEYGYSEKYILDMKYINGKKKSMLIGCSDYDNESSNLYCVKNDIHELDDILEKCGFENEVFHNLTKDNLKLKLMDFSGKCKEGELCLIYFSGHGCNSENGESYIMPVDYYKNYNNGESLEQCGIRVDDIIRIMPTCQVLIIVDACRSNIVEMQPLDLAKVNIKKDMYIMYATQNSQKAFGNQDGLSYFTEAFIETLKKDEELSLDDMAIEIRNTLFEKGYEQLPISISGMTRKVFLNKRYC